MGKSRSKHIHIYTYIYTYRVCIYIHIHTHNIYIYIYTHIFCTILYYIILYIHIRIGYHTGECLVLRGHQTATGRRHVHSASHVIRAASGPDVGVSQNHRPYCDDTLAAQIPIL